MGRKKWVEKKLKLILQILKFETCKKSESKEKMELTKSLQSNKKVYCRKF